MVGKIPDEIEAALKEIASRADPAKDMSQITYKEFTAIAGFIQTMSVPPEEPFVMEAAPKRPARKPASKMEAQLAAAVVQPVVRQPEWRDPAFDYNPSVKGDDSWSEVARLCDLIRRGLEVRIEYGVNKGIFRNIDALESIALQERHKNRGRK